MAMPPSFFTTTFGANSSEPLRFAKAAVAAASGASDTVTTTGVTRNASSPDPIAWPTTPPTTAPNRIQPAIPKTFFTLHTSTAAHGCLFAGDADAGKIARRDQINAATGFGAPGTLRKRPGKNLMGMGNQPL